MNDFTIDELKELRDCIEWKLLHGNPTEITLPVKYKIQYIIDNYCEHEPEYKSESGLIICEGDINKPLRCKKCGEYYE